MKELSEEMRKAMDALIEAQGDGNMLCIPFPTAKALYERGLIYVHPFFIPRYPANPKNEWSNQTRPYRLCCVKARGYNFIGKAMVYGMPNDFITRSKD